MRTTSSPASSEPCPYPDGVVALAGQRGCDLILVGTEGGNAVTRLLTGSSVPGLITRAGVPVMVCHAHDPCPGRDKPAA